jgi:outer membrane receptor protein involved in Fe transport
LRYHAWEDNDGPDATTLFDHRMGSGGEHHNCTPGGTWERPASQQTLADLIPQGFGSDVTISPTWICGQIPIPTAAQIGQDTGSTRALALRSNVNDVELLPNSVLPDQFGLAREAQEMSLVANVNFENGVILSFTGAAHEDFYGTYNDFDQRASEGLYEQGLGGSMFGFFGQNHPADAQNARITNLEDSSLEFRLSSSQDKRFRWSVGYSDTQIDTERQSTGSLIITHAVDGIDNEFAQYPTSYNPYWVFGGDSTFSNALFNGTTNFGLGRLGINDGIDWADIHTTAIFGSMSFDFTDKLSASLEIRRQEDDVTEGNYLYTKSAVDPVDGSFSATIPDRPAGLSDTFKSTLPRFIVDYKPSDDATLYFSYAEGTRPGLFNTGLAGLSDAELAQVLPQNNGTGVSVGEEELESMEVGFKSYFLDGRGYLAVALYKMKIENLHTSTFALSYTDDDGAAQNITGSFVSDGASVDMGGVEVEGSVLLNENWSLGFTYAQNNSEFGNDFFSSQAFDLLGDATLAAGKPFSRSPVNSGSLSLDYKRNMNANWDLFARGDVIYTGKMYASQANITHTGDSTRINLRFGFSSDDTTVELYCLNCTDDDTPKSLQAMFDFSGISGGFSDVPAGIGGARALGVALADKPLVGIRASYAFGGDR